MQNLIIITLLSLLTLSCSTSDFESESTINGINHDKIAQLHDLNENATRVAFRLLNHEEKYTFRMSFIDHFVSNSNLNETQIDLIEELTTNFKSEVYLNNDYAEYFKTIFIPDWSDRASQYFTKEELRFMANSLNKNTFFKETNTDRAPNDCKCHEGGFFKCTKKVIVSTGTGYPEIIDVDVQTELVDCDSIACQVPGSINNNGEWEEDTGGCGWFLLEQCNGTC